MIDGYKYEYDNLGNITKIYQSQSPYNLLVAYTYDSQNQLTREVHYDGSGTAASNITKSYSYTYDTAGNILSETKTEGSTTTTKTYSYNNTQWRDLLTGISVNGGTTQTLSYDGSGNPTSYHNGEKSYTNLTWQQGRNLISVTVGGATTTYAYDMNGIRTQKTANGVVHTYVTQNGKVVRETIGSGTTAKVLDFIYDESGRPFALIYTNGTADSVTYYYVLNLQGDVVGLIDASGVWYAQYSYNAWGEITQVLGRVGNKLISVANSAPDHIANLNPLRYRGYVYDNETGWYYLQSRYYDPVTHRFINADSLSSTGQGILGTNMFAYCLNNPANLSDPNGHASSSNNDSDGNGIPDYLDNRWREMTEIVKLSYALRDMGFADDSYSAAKQCYNALRLAEIDTAEEKAHFFSQCYVESRFSLLEAGYCSPEVADAYRRDQLYFPYYGAGYLQLTWAENYLAFSEYMGDSRIYDEGPQYVAENYAWLSAGWFWMDNNINSVIATDGSVYAVTYAVNRGLNGFNDRYTYYLEFLDYWGG